MGLTSGEVRLPLARSGNILGKSGELLGNLYRVFLSSFSGGARGLHAGLPLFVVIFMVSVISTIEDSTPCLWLSELSSLHS